MKRLLILFCFLIFIVFAFVFSNLTLKDVLSINIVSCGSLKMSELGFVCESYNTSNYKNYTNNGCVVGECASLSLNKNEINKLCDKLGLMITNKYNVDDKYIIEGYSSKIPYFINDKNFNVQISVTGENVVIGTPIIYGSY